MERRVGPMVFKRVLAILALCVPGALGVYGWTLMRDVIFHSMAGKGFAWLPFIGGLVLFLLGVSFLAGFIFYRDAKRNLVQPKLRKKKG